MFFSECLVQPLKNGQFHVSNPFWCARTWSIERILQATSQRKAFWYTIFVCCFTLPDVTLQAAFTRAFFSFTDSLLTGSGHLQWGEERKNVIKLSTWTCSPNTYRKYFFTWKSVLFCNNAGFNSVIESLLLDNVQFFNYICGFGSIKIYFFIKHVNILINNT